MANHTQFRQARLRTILAALALALACGAGSLASLQADPAVSGFAIDRANRNAVAAGYHLYYSASEGFEAVTNYTGNVSTCTPGTISVQMQDMTLRRINYYRAQAGVPADIVFDSVKNTKCQEAATIMAWQNDLSHSPNIDFPSNPCLTPGGNEAAGAGNLSLGNYGPGSIDSQMIDDGPGNSAAGHRRWLLYSRAQEMGQGAVPFKGTYPYALPEHSAASCIWVVGNFKTAPPAQAVPWPNEGFIPYQLVPNDGTGLPRWSFSYPGADFSAASVTMARGATAIPVTVETLAPNVGDNTIVWRPSGIPQGAPAADTAYTVTINGISGAPFTNTSYDVTVIDPFTVNDPAVITGPAAPVAGAINPYSFTAVDGAEAYELCISEAVAGTWLEGAETAPAPQVIDHTDGGYALLSSAFPATGTRAFHLATPDFDDEDFVIDRTIVPQAGSQIRFQYRRLFMHESTILHVEVSLDGGSSFSSIHTLPGQMTGPGPFNSGDWDPAYTPETVDVPAQYLNEPMMIRFRIEATGLTITGTGDTIGLHLDGIDVTNSLELIDPTLQALAGGASSFGFNPAAADRQYYLQIRPELGGHQFGYGPSLVVTSAPPPPLPVITSPATVTGAQGESFSYTIIATNAPTSFGATGLPAGASIDTATGEITGQITPGTYPGITISATNGGGTGNAPLTITVLTGYEQWVADNYPGLGGPLDDDDNDRVSNFVEASVAGMNPTIADVHLLPAHTFSIGNITGTVMKSGVPGIDYGALRSPSGQDGSWTASGITTPVDNATTFTFSYSYTVIPWSAQFVRFTFTQNNDPTL